MAALAADINVSTVGNVVTAKFSANAADTYYQGAVVFMDTGGGVQVVPAAGDMCLGISPKQQVIAAATDEVEVLIKGYVWMPLASGAAADNEGDYVALDISATQSDNIADFQPAGDITVAANDACLGRILRVATASMLVAIEAGGVTGNLYVATAGWGG